MVRQLLVGGALVAASTLWFACSSGDDVDVDGVVTCSSTPDCYEGGNSALGTECLEGVCKCPFEGDEICCKPGTEEEDGHCERMCRPADECAGAAVTCKEAEECPGPVDPRCGVAKCVQGICQLQLVSEIESQLRGDCKVIQCDEQGAMVEREFPEDVFNDGNQCTTDTCNGTTIVNAPRVKGPAPESTGYCDGKGQWVGCLEDEDCGNPSLVCSKRGTCVWSTCRNDKFDSLMGETATDCGGDKCDPCAAGQPCKVGNDCIEHLCGSDKRCADAACDDGVQNDSETDVDCGSPSCGGCPDGAGCASHAGCLSGVCWVGICQVPDCDDGVENGQETGVDCGGPCAPCL